MVRHRQCLVNLSFNNPPGVQPFVAGNAGLRTLETPQKLPVCQESQMHTPNPMQKNGQRLRTQP